MNQKLANPGPLGLAAFGMTTILLNLHNAGFFPVSTPLMTMGIFYGGLAQVCAGMMEYKRGNTFGTTAFTSYGAFWLTLVFSWIFAEQNIGQAPSEAYAGWYLFLWGVFTGFMYFGTLKLNKVKQFVFASLTVLFVLLAVRDWTGSSLIGTTAGWLGIACGASALYLAVATVVNEVHGREALWIGEPQPEKTIEVPPGSGAASASALGV